MVTAVCSSSPREIENRIEADHPVVSVAALFSSLCRIKMSTDTTPACRSANASNHSKFFLQNRAQIFYLTFSLHIFFLLVSSSLSTLRFHDASAGAGLSGGRERGGPAVQDYFSGDSRRCEYEMCFFQTVCCSCVEVLILFFVYPPSLCRTWKSQPTN